LRSRIGDGEALDAANIQNIGKSRNEPHQPSLVSLHFCCDTA
jgi:hypothetical protein